MKQGNSRFKFRAWDIANKEMYQVGTLTFEKSTGNLVGVLHPDPIMQYTGLKDKNGVEIYEGDIVDWHYIPWNTGGLGDERRKAVIEFKDGCFSRHKDMKVIGNIHQNPELLEND